MSLAPLRIASTTARAASTSRPAGHATNGAIPRQTTAPRTQTATPSPSPSPIAKEPSVVPNSAWPALILALIIGAIAAALRISAVTRAGKVDPKQPTRLEIASVIIAFAAGMAALVRALAVPVTSSAAWTPNLDGITLAWVGAAVIGLILPLLSEITVGSVTIKMAKLAQDLLDETSNVLKSWVAALNTYMEDAESVTAANKNSWTERLEQFVLWRLSEASEWVGTPADAPLRLAVLLADPTGQQLYYTYTFGFAGAPPPDPMNATEGIAGAAFTENISRNEIDPSSFPPRMFKRFTRPTRVGKSLLVIPIAFGDRRLGVLSIDRARHEYFDDKAISVLITLAHILGIAIGEAERISKL